MSQRTMHAAHFYDESEREALLPAPDGFLAMDVARPVECAAPIVWFTGLSGSGKSTLCRALADALTARGMLVHVLDGDELRQTVCADLGFTRADREENVRRIAELAGMLAARGVTVLVAAITPYRAMRKGLREVLDRYVEIYVDAPLATCMARDPKGLYRRAMNGELRNFTGVSDVYEEPEQPDVICGTDHTGVELSVSRLIRELDVVLERQEDVRYAAAS